MRNSFYIPISYLLVLLFFGMNLPSISAQLLPRQPRTINYAALLTPQVDDGKKQINFDITREMEEMLRYARMRVNPMKRDLKTDQFINRYFPYSETRLMKNGDIYYLKFYYEKYLRTLTECLDLARNQPLEFAVTRRTFMKKSELATRKEKRIYWRKFDSKRNELIANFFQFRQYILPAISTEISMILQEEHHPQLTISMNQLENLDKSPLEVMVYSNNTLGIPERKDSRIAGLSIISKCDNIFTSGSPAVRNAYPGLRGSNKGLTVHLRLFEDGVTLSHELGHLYYLYYKWEEYVAYIRRKGKDYEPGGHGPDDPSGLAARMTEEGKMPF